MVILFFLFFFLFRNLSKRVKKLCELALVEIVLGNNNPRKGRTITTRRWIRMPAGSSSSPAFGTLAFRLLRINSVRLPLLSDKKRKRKKTKDLFVVITPNTMAINESFVVLFSFLIFSPH
jgi:hypothetical protein